MVDFVSISGSNPGRSIGYAYRVYKSANRKVIAVDEISIIEDVIKTNTRQFHHRAHRENTRMLVHHTDVDRHIVYITMLGDYTSITEDLNQATWVKPSAENAVVIEFNDLPQVGDLI
jgi:hypothetical protein